MKYTWFASISVGLEAVLRKELMSHGLECTPETGGVSFQADWKTIQHISPYLRTPTTLKLQLIISQPVEKLSDISIKSKPSLAQITSSSAKRLK